MDIQVGIPQALLYYDFGSLWTSFFKELGVRVVLSGETTRKTLDRGTSLAVDESCLPLKVYLGHVDELLPKCSNIFVPHMVQYHKNFHFCAKFAGLPDIVRNTFKLKEAQLITPSIEGKSPANQLKLVYNVCKELGLPLLLGQLAFKRALKKWQEYNINLSQEEGIKIALLGHSYLVNDTFFCCDIIKCLTRQGISVMKPDNIAAKWCYKETQAADPDIYWQLSAKLVGAMRYYCRRNDIAGIIMVSSFGCGPDSLINEYLIERVLKESGKPYTVIDIDEHTGSAGLITRVEAFGDLVKWRFKN